MAGVLIIGGSGLLGELAYRRRDIDDVHITTHHCNIEIDNVVSHQLDASNVNAVKYLLEEVKPHLVINCSGIANVNLCEEQPDLSFEGNVKTADNLSESVAFREIPFIHISTDHLFNGVNQKLLKRQNRIHKIFMQKHKLEAEKVVLRNCSGALILRTTFFGLGTLISSIFLRWYTGRS